MVTLVAEVVGFSASWAILGFLYYKAVSFHHTRKRRIGHTSRAGLISVVDVGDVDLVRTTRDLWVLNLATQITHAAMLGEVGNGHWHMNAELRNFLAEFRLSTYRKGSELEPKLNKLVQFELCRWYNKDFRGYLDTVGTCLGYPIVNDKNAEDATFCTTERCKGPWMNSL